MAPFPLHAADMKDYCIIPPYVKTDLQPNIFVIMDNSYKMGEPAYTDMHSYDPTKTYPGYFQPNVYYSYGSGNQFKPDQNGIFKGNLLNWVMTSRYDLLQSILVGGVSSSRQLRQVNTLKSIGNTWRKTYNGCVFDVTDGSFTVSELVGNACKLLDPARLSASLQPAQPIVLARNAQPFDFFKNITENTKSASDKFLDFLVAPAFAAPSQPLEIRPSSLLDATEGGNYSVTIQAVQRPTQDPFSWSIIVGSLPNGLILDASTALSVEISGIPTAGSAGAGCGISGYTGQSYPFTIKILDKNGTWAKWDFSIFVNCPVTRPPQTFTGRVCAGDYWLNCDSPSLACVSDSDCLSNECASGTCSLKSGIIELFWTQARFGLGAFVESAKTVSTSIPTTPTSAGCIPASPMTSYMSAGIENTQPNVGMPKNVGDVPRLTPLINAEYDAIHYYAYDNSNSCNPYNSVNNTCLKNFILMITSGDGADTYIASPYLYTDSTHCDSYTYNLSKNACFGYNNDLRNNPTFGVDNLGGVQNVSTYIVNVLGVNGTILNEAAKAGGGKYYAITDPTQLRAQLIQAFQDIIARAASGTAASVLASGAGEGANLIQAVFYPRRKFYNSATDSYDEIIWTGRLANLWYYVDPRFTTSTMLEDTTPDKKLNLSTDRTVKLRYDNVLEATVADRYSYGSTTKIDSVPFELVNYLWEAGLMLWNRNVTTDPRTIFTTTNGTSLLSGGFSVANASTASLKSALGFGSGSDAEALIKYIHGYDDNFSISGNTYSFRPRKVSVDINGDKDTLDDFTINGEIVSESPSKIWKLGDIINSTPKIASWIKLNTYDDKYRDTTYTAYLNSDSAGKNYINRGTVFAGANDGMLHAFKLGKLEVSEKPVNCSFGTNEYACLYNPNSSIPIGKELWAFIPRNALPYLKYLTDPLYCHVFTVDLHPYIFDASIYGNATDTKTVDSWRTILIGGMRFGGASRDAMGSCNSTTDGLPDCVKTPINGIGFSSYFALDITDFLAHQDDVTTYPPQLLWEFSDPRLGFATAGAAVVRIGDRNQNGNWFVVLGSGPTGPINTSTQQFLGHSDQNLRLFVLDLKTGTQLSGSPIDTGIANAFAGSMINATIDPDLDYTDEVIYIPYVKKAADGTWTDGGVGRLLTRKSASLSDWERSPLIDGIGPVTSSVANLQRTSDHKLWLFFGTGRYFFEQQSTVDDGNNRRRIYGVKEPCYDLSAFKTTCPALGTLTNVTSPPSPTDPEPANGWYIDLDPCSDLSGNPLSDCSSASVGYRPERVITDPLAVSTSVVFFTTFKPYSDVCSLGGKSFIWAVKYNTGGYAGALLRGVALLQVSTGSIEQKDLSTAFNQSDATGGRRTSAMEGVPPTAQGLSVLTAPPPVKRIIHLRER